MANCHVRALQIIIQVFSNAPECPWVLPRCPNSPLPNLSYENSPRLPQILKNIPQALFIISKNSPTFTQIFSKSPNSREFPSSSVKFPTNSPQVTTKFSQIPRPFRIPPSYLQIFSNSLKIPAKFSLNYAKFPQVLPNFLDFPSNSHRIPSNSL